MRAPPAAADRFSPPGSSCTGGTEQGGANGGANNGGSSLRMDRELAYLVRRQLKAFTSDPRQRLLAFPRSFSAGDRYQVCGCPTQGGALYMLGAWGMHPTASRTALPALSCAALLAASL
jgi:hypothetical protein